MQHPCWVCKMLIAMAKTVLKNIKTPRIFFFFPFQAKTSTQTMASLINLVTYVPEKAY